MMHADNTTEDRYELVVTKDTEYIDRGGQNASDWKRYTVKAGRYPVEWVDISHRPTETGGRPYYGRIVMDAVLEEAGGVNRVGGSTSSYRRTYGDDATLIVSPYAYSVHHGMQIGGLDNAVVRYYGRHTDEELAEIEHADRQF